MFRSLYLCIPLAACVLFPMCIHSQTVKDKTSHNLQNALLIPDEITELNLNGSQDYKVLPADIAKLVNLKTLKMFGCGLQSLCPEIGQLKNLEVLDLGGNYLKILPPEIAGLTSLRNLSLQRNELTELPGNIGSLENLVNLNLANNKLTALPMSLYRLKNLITLDLQFNELSYISPMVVSLSHVQTMNLSRNKLEKIPESIWATPDLLYLNLYKCGAMLTLPADLCKIPSSLQKRVAYIDNAAAPATTFIPHCPAGYGWIISISY